MADPPRIRTPWSQQFRRIRYQLVPVVAFGVALSLTLWLWRRQAAMPHAVGEVEVVRYEMAAPFDGLLAPLRGQPVERFDRVNRGAVVARLDDRPTGALLATIQMEVRRLQAELAATKARAQQELAVARMDLANEQRRQRTEIRRLAIDIERLRLDILDRKALIQTDRIELQRLDQQLKATKDAHEKHVETSYTLADVRLLRDTVKQRVESNERALVEAEEQLKIVSARKDGAASDSQAPPSASAATLPNIETLLAPVRTAVSVQEARMREVEIQIQSLEIHAPISGTIHEIYRRPGQAVRAGEPILAIAVDQSQHVISYVRQDQSVQPTKGMKVNVRTRGVPRRMVEGEVERVGPQVAEVPLHHLRDPSVQEWGLPVRIAVPDVSGLPPGELVDIIFTFAPPR